MSNEDIFITKSTVETKETIEVDGVEYPVFKMEISRTSHPFYTGKSKLIDTVGRIDKSQQQIRLKSKIIYCFFKIEKSFTSVRLFYCLNLSTFEYCFKQFITLTIQHNELYPFDGTVRNALLPFTFTRPVADIRVGILTIREKWENI